MKYRSSTRRTLGDVVSILLMLGVCAAPVCAREFRSNCNLEVFQKGDDGEPDRYLGFIREEGPHTVDVPSGDNWYVHPVGKYTDDAFAKLAEDLKAKHVPGLSLTDRWDVTNETLKTLLGWDRLHILLLANTRVDDASLQALKHLSQLEVLSLGRQISDAGLAQLSSLSRLNDLDLTHSRITDHGLRALATLPHLETLILTETKITDNGAAVLGEMTSLTHLDISGTAVTDKGIQKISQLPRLEALYVGKAITDAGLQHIANLSKLRALDLSGTRITSGGLAPLRHMTRLRELALSGTKVGDLGLTIISPLTDLRVLELSDTKVTSDGLGDLAPLANLETLSVSWDQLTETELQMLTSLKHLKFVILNGSQMPPDVLNRVRTLAQLHTKKVQQVAMLEPKQMTVSPTLTSTLKPSAAPTLQPAVAPNAPMSIEETAKVSPRSIQAPALAPDLVPEQPEKQAIAMNTTPKGAPMIFDVNVRPKASQKVMMLTGLKRVHLVEMGDTSEEPDLAPGETSQIASPKETAENSLGEINVNATPAHRQSQ